MDKIAKMIAIVNFGNELAEPCAEHNILAKEIRQQIARELVECSLHMVEGDQIKFTECVNKVLLLDK